MVELDSLREWSEMDAALVREEMAALLSGCPDSFRPVVDHLLAAAGKGLRGRLALVCARAGSPRGKKEREARANALRVAAVIELLHLATLVHDDVIDNAPVRRGKPSVQAAFGKKVAVMTGDYLFTVCFESVRELGMEPMTLLSRTMGKICAGEMLQHQHSRNPRLTLRQYLRIIGRKTAALFACSAAAGARAGEAKEEWARGLGVFAVYLGLIFQIADDCLDYGAQGALDKPVLQDIQMGVVTLPVLYTLWSCPDRVELERLIAKPELEPWELELLCRRVREYRGVEQSLELARRYGEKARRKLDRLPVFPQKEELYTLLEQALDRSR